MPKSLVKGQRSENVPSIRSKNLGSVSTPSSRKTANASTIFSDGTKFAESNMKLCTKLRAGYGCRHGESSGSSLNRPRTYSTSTSSQLVVPQQRITRLITNSDSNKANDRTRWTNGERSVGNINSPPQNR